MMDCKFQHINLTVKMGSCVILLGIGVIPDIVYVAREKVVELAVVAYCDSLSTPAYYDFVDELGKNKQFAILRAIQHADLPHASYAASAIVRALPTEKALAYCKELEVDSPAWNAAFFALDSHPKEKVIRYVKCMADTPNLARRSLCYNICRVAGWDDLTGPAKCDASNSAVLVGRSFPIGITLGEIATRYLDSIGNERSK